MGSGVPEMQGRAAEAPRIAASSAAHSNQCTSPTPPAGFYQRRVAAVRLLGELYNYKLLNSHVVFATLHLILAYGHEAGTPPEVTRWVLGAGGHVQQGGSACWGACQAMARSHMHLPGACCPSPHHSRQRIRRLPSPCPCPSPPPHSRLDPPANFFRIRLVCTLLEVCGQYFTRGAARKKLDRFLPYLQVGGCRGGLVAVTGPVKLHGGRTYSASFGQPLRATGPFVRAVSSLTLVLPRSTCAALHHGQAPAAAGRGV